MNLPSDPFADVQRGSIVRFEWYDAYSGKGGWEAADEVINTTEAFCITAGFYIGQKDGFVAIAASIDTDAGNVTATQVIPTVWIASEIEVLWAPEQPAEDPPRYGFEM